MTTFFSPNRHLIFVSARIEGPAGFSYELMALDTDATRTTVDPAKLTRLGYDLTAAPQVRMTTASGKIAASLVTLDKIEALEQEQIGLQVLAHALPASLGITGLLGLDFVRGHELVIDFRKGQITLRV